MPSLKLKAEHITLSSKNRLYNCDKPIIGLTGSIATGKSTVSEYLSQQNHLVIDADQLIKEIYSSKEAKDFINSEVPAAIDGSSINFQVLRELFFNDSKLKSNIETFLYAKLPSAFKAAMDKMPQAQFIIYDVPLLFEKGINTLVDKSIVIYTRPELQLSRLIARDGNSEELSKKIISSQISIENKKKMANFIIDNSNDLNTTISEANKLFALILE